jgi:tRNA modification GTPase
VKHPDNEIIAAIASPIGPGGIGVIRISGRGADKIFSKLFVSSNGTGIESHRMQHGWLIDPRTKGKVDEIMACFMCSPKSYTGEDVVEFYCHGSVAVLQRALNLVLGTGARLAQKGEFTKRAFLNRKIDLAQAEAVLDLVRAQTADGAGYAVRQLEGRLSRAVKDTRDRLVHMLAGLEVLIDFPEDLPEIDYKAVIKSLRARIKVIDNLLASADSGRIYRQGLATVIVGKPNVGKSCLLNALLGEERAIVTELPGTTRDSIEEVINIRGLALRVIDTAGIRHARDKAEEFGIERAQKELEAADFVLIVIDASKRLSSLDRKVIGMAQTKRGVIVLNKVDLGQKVKINEIRSFSKGFQIFKTAALYDMGISELKKGIYAHVGNLFKLIGRDSLTINERHRECLEIARKGLITALASALKRLPVDFITIDVKGAIIALGEITGELVSDEVINTIFDQFCVGK